ncbi:MAG: dihydrodipicolinate synthase family protein [Isosphaeraceae bacterium]
MLEAGVLVGRTIAAVPVTFGSDGRIDEAAQENYVAYLDREPVDGVTVWAHTGRGLRLDREQRSVVLRTWRAGFGGERPILAAAGIAPGITEWREALDSARGMAELAAELGAEAVLVHPPLLVRSVPDSEARIVAYHDEIARAGLPLVLFFLYEAAGGITYSSSVLRELLARPQVLGIKMATLDSVMTFQDVSELIRSEFPDRVLLSGEDRFLGYSLMCGAEATLIGMASARVAIQSELLRAHRSGNAGRFLGLSRRVDQLAVHTFKAPMEGYIQRMLWCLVHDGVIPRAAAYDPWGPPLDETEFHALGRFLRQLHEETAA